MSEEKKEGQCCGGEASKESCCSDQKNAEKSNCCSNGGCLCSWLFKKIKGLFTKSCCK